MSSCRIDVWRRRQLGNAWKNCPCVNFFLRKLLPASFRRIQGTHDPDNGSDLDKDAGTGDDDARTGDN